MSAASHEIEGSLRTFNRHVRTSPIPTAIADPEPFTPETLAAIEVGRTTQDEVRAVFANWNYTTDDGVQTVDIDPQISPDGRFWVFPLARQMGDVAIAGLVAYGPVLVPVLNGAEDNYQDYWVLVEFDVAGVVAAMWITRERAPCEPGAVCYRNEHLLVLANEVGNETGLAEIRSGECCAVCTYARADFDTPVMVSDGSRVDPVFGKTTFLRNEITGRLATGGDSGARCADRLASNGRGSGQCPLRTVPDELASRLKTAGEPRRYPRRRTNSSSMKSIRSLPQNSSSPT